MKFQFLSIRAMKGVRVYTCACICVCDACICVCACVNIYMYVCMCVSIYMHVYMCRHVCCKYMCMCRCMCVVCMNIILSIPSPLSRSESLRDNLPKSVKNLGHPDLVFVFWILSFGIPFNHQFPTVRWRDSWQLEDIDSKLSTAILLLVSEERRRNISCP